MKRKSVFYVGVLKSESVQKRKTGTFLSLFVPEKSKIISHYACNEVQVLSWTYGVYGRRSDKLSTNSCVMNFVQKVRTLSAIVSKPYINLRQLQQCFIHHGGHL